MRRSRLLGALLAACAFGAQAQFATAIDPDWKEQEAPPPPALKAEKLVPFEMPGSTLRWGVDPASISIGADGVVRYVVVATGDGGALNAMYEGVRCNTAEVKVYARHTGEKWTPLADAEWMPLQGSSARRHSLLIARNGACIGHGPNRSPTHVARDLGTGGDYKFRSEVR